jgi:hypothetical protein
MVSGFQKPWIAGVWSGCREGRARGENGKKKGGRGREAFSPMVSSTMRRTARERERERELEKENEE